MRHKITRIIVGAVMIVVGLFVLIYGKWWNGAIMLPVGAMFLFFAFKTNGKK